MQKNGLLIGQFAPLTLHHLRHINALLGQTQSLDIVVLPPKSLGISAQDCARWLQVAMQGIGFVRVHTQDSLSLSQSDLKRLSQNPKNANAVFIKALQLDDPIVFDNIVLDNIVLDNIVLDNIVLDNIVLDNIALDNITLEATLQNTALGTPSFDDLAFSCRYFYGTSVAIVGGESSGKTVLVQKLANHYGASVALEMGRLYADSHLGGTETPLQYSDYGVIANAHANAIYDAKNQGKPLTLIDTDFITTQVFCEVYEKKTHPLVDAFIDEFYDISNPYRIRHTIYLDNNVKWVADGTRRLGNQRSAFAQRLLDKYQKHQIPLSVIDHPDYHERYRQAVALIDGILANTRIAYEN